MLSVTAAKRLASEAEEMTMTLFAPSLATSAARFAPALPVPNSTRWPRVVCSKFRPVTGTPRS